MSDLVISALIFKFMHASMTSYTAIYEAGIVTSNGVPWKLFQENFDVVGQLDMEISETLVTYVFDIKLIS